MAFTGVPHNLFTMVLKYRCTGKTKLGEIFFENIEQVGPGNFMESCLRMSRVLWPGASINACWRPPVFLYPELNWVYRMGFLSIKYIHTSGKTTSATFSRVPFFSCLNMMFCAGLLSWRRPSCPEPESLHGQVGFGS